MRGLASVLVRETPDVWALGDCAPSTAVHPTVTAVGCTADKVFLWSQRDSTHQAHRRHTRGLSGLRRRHVNRRPRVNSARRADGRKVLPTHPLGDHLGDAVAAHADAVESVGDLHRRLLVGDDDQLTLLA